MKFGLYGASLGAMASPDAFLVAQLAEALGYESLWTGEHMALPDPQVPPSHRAPTHPFFDPIVAMTFLAAHTSSIKLGLGVLVLPQRHPVQLAKELATLDILSRGRLLVGVGVGYLESEYRAVGADFATRGARADEYLDALRILWRDERPAYHGRFVELDGINAYPRPATAGGPPILVGGHSASGRRRTVEYGNGWIGFGREPEEIGAEVARIRDLAVTVGRDPGEIEITATTRSAPSPDLVERFAMAGVDRLVLVAEGASLGEVEEIVRRYAPGR